MKFLKYLLLIWIFIQAKSCIESMSVDRGIMSAEMSKKTRVLMGNPGFCVAKLFRLNSSKKGDFYVCISALCTLPTC